MKIDRLIWGIVLLFIGVVLLLDNFNVINFYWRNVWEFWPVFLIIAGINILFKRNNSQTGSIISLGVLVLALGFLFYKGQQEPKNKSWWSSHKDSIITYKDDENDEDSLKKVDLKQPFTVADSTKKVILNISGGGLSFNLNGETNDLINADIEQKGTTFTLDKEVTDSATVLTLKMPSKKSSWNFGSDGNDINLKLNKVPLWDINMKLGAGEADFDLSQYKVRTFNFNGGAASLELKFGDLLPITDVNVKSGVASVEINIPKNSGCRIISKTGLSSKSFDGFDKINATTSETPNYATSKNKIFINLDGGLSSFEVNRY
ncbi:hypothetical protein EZJ43_12435 [Pedobacter changchengzhani]|uniref:LiaF transmembrane domain-containing protein n=1 Tax=Pedobacter changchengzhani TaxID=2529274 RepID=A0A4R5MIP8_9SPHI|nr:DUF5668 domain-containing protein [Pedobacter changchengzhani]TDG35431.1 hypothetical protein EZJ43_12435 [Pedobacter changchengzhani]